MTIHLAIDAVPLVALPALGLAALVLRSLRHTGHVFGRSVR